MDGNQTPAGQPELPQPVQPGQTISPGDVSAPAPPEPAAQLEQQPPAPVTDTAAPQADTPAMPEPVDEKSTTPPSTTGLEHFNEPLEAPALAPATSGPVSWTASEFIAHEKSANWYILLFGGAVIVAGANWLIFKDILSSVVIVIAVILLAAYSKRQPRQLQYTLDSNGITIGEKQYPYGHFRSFSVIDDGAFSCIELMPLKRFSPPISVYYAPANEEAIAAALTPHLPFQPHQPDPVDKLIRRIRF
jgi:hypothetical protein